MYKVLNKKRKIILMFCMVLMVILLCIWAVKLYLVNANAFHQKVIHYSMGETVQLENNFFSDGEENTEGYSIRVNSAKLEKYSEFLESYNEKVQVEEGEPVPEYVCLLNVTVKNVSNQDGYISAMGFALFNGALQLPVDFEVWNMIDKKLNGNTILKLRKDSEVTIKLPFVSQALDEATDSKELNDRLENDVFDFFVCDFPVRKLIEVKFDQ